MRKDILDIFKLKGNTDQLSSSQPNESSSGTNLPKCPKCNKVPLKCPTPNDCGMENL